MKKYYIQWILIFSLPAFYYLYNLTVYKTVIYGYYSNFVNYIKIILIFISIIEIHFIILYFKTKRKSHIFTWVLLFFHILVLYTCILKRCDICLFVRYLLNLSK